MNQAPDILEYSNYRKFLRDQYTYLHAQDRNFSYLYCAKKIGVSKNYIKLIIDGKRHVGVDKVLPVGKVFKLDSEQCRFLFFLFLKSTVQDHELQDYIKYVISSFKSKLRPKVYEYPMTPNQNVFDDWVKMTLHSMVRLKQFRPDPKWIKDQLNEDIPLATIQRAWEELLKEGAILEEDGKFRPKNFIFGRPRHENPEDWQVPRQHFLKSAESILEPQNFLPMSYFTTMVAMNQQDSRKMIERSLELRNMIIETSKTSEDPDQVFFILNHFYGVSK